MDSYIDLLNEGNNEALWDDSHISSPVEEQQSPVVKPSNKRSRNFSTKEDNMLVSAWLEIGMDPVHGNEQSGNTYWHKIYEFFHEHKDFESDRNQSSLNHRWATIRGEVSKFCGCHERILNRRQSGISSHDKIAQAMELYKAEEKKSFSLMHCWNVLHLHPKWTETLSQKRVKKTSNASPGSSTPGTNSSRYDDGAEELTPTSEHMERPLGRKEAKERQRGKTATSGNDNIVLYALENMWSKKTEVDVAKELNKKERSDRRYALQVERNALQVQRNAAEDRIIAVEQERNANERKLIEVREREVELKTRLENERIMNMDISVMSEAQKQYYLGLQNDIISRR